MFQSNSNHLQSVITVPLLPDTSRCMMGLCFFPGASPAAEARAEPPPSAVGGHLPVVHFQELKKVPRFGLFIKCNHLHHKGYFPGQALWFDHCIRMYKETKYHKAWEAMDYEFRY